MALARKPRRAGGRRQPARVVPERAPCEPDQRAEQNPLRPEVAVSPAEEPDANADHVDERVLKRERAPARVARADCRQLRRGQLAQHMVELGPGARRVRLVEPLLELLEREPTG